MSSRINENINKKDLQVPPKENLTEIKTALTKGNNEDITVLELSNINHLFQTAVTGSPREYSKIDKFYHKITSAIFKADIVIEQEQYIFPKNRVYAKKAVAVYYFYRRLFRGMSFLSGYFELHEQINEYVPLTDELILNIKLRLEHLTEILKHREFPDREVTDIFLIEKWRKNITVFKQNDCRNIDERILVFFYGLTCILEDMDKLRAHLNVRLRNGKELL